MMTTMRFLKLCCLSCFLTVMIGCASNPQPVEQQLAVAENPYLSNRKQVSREALSRFEQAHESIKNQQWQAAEQQLAWIIENHPDLSGPYLDLALVYKQMGATEKANHYFSQALEVNPSNQQAYNQYGIFLREQGEFQRAEAVYLQALAIWADYPDTHRNLGVLYDLYLGKHKAALQHYYRYQELTSGSDRLVAAWIVDLERQLMTVAQGD